MSRRFKSFWWVALLGVVCVVAGVWAFVYSCNREVAACKGTVPWPAVEGFVHRAGWGAIAVGLVLITVAIVGGVWRLIHPSPSQVTRWRKT